MRVLLDVDGVLADFLTPALDTIYALTETRIDPESMTSWDLFDALDVSERTRNWVKRQCWLEWGKPEWCAALQPLPGAQRMVKDLRTQGADVYTVTAAHVNWLGARSDWLQEHFEIDRSRQVFTLAKHVVAGDLLVDDHPDHINDWARAHPKGISVLWSYAYNAPTELPIGCVRGRETELWDAVRRTSRCG